MPGARLEPSAPYARHPLRPHQLLGVPRIDPGDWSLTIDRLVRRPLHLSFAEFVTRPRMEITSVHQCCGSPLQPDVSTRRVCNVTWSGVRLTDLIAECQPEPAARFVPSSVADHGNFEGVECDAYVKDLHQDNPS